MIKENNQDHSRSNVVEQALRPFESRGTSSAVWNASQYAVRQATLEELAEITRRLLVLVQQKKKNDWDTVAILLQEIPARVQMLRREHRLLPEQESRQFMEVMEQAYRASYERYPHRAGQLLQAILHLETPESVRRVAGLLKACSTDDWNSVAIGLKPLWSLNPDLAKHLFAELGPEDVQPQILPVLLDLANFLKHEAKLPVHPWQGYSRLLVRLLSGLIAQLEKSEEDPRFFGTSVEQIQSRLDHSLALATSLAHALALIGDRSAIPALEGMMELSHRRLQAEAAAALARLEHEAGQQRLIDLAADPMARLWAVHYARELGLADKIDPQYTEPAALAESKLAQYLAAPQQCGIAPHRLELVDSRKLDWPGFAEPQQCWLFRFEYKLPSGRTWTNIGFTGPETMVVREDLTGRPVEEIYEVFREQAYST